MIATSRPDKTDCYTTSATTTNYNDIHDEVMTYGPMVEVVFPPAKRLPEPHKPRVERTAQRYIDHLWPVMSLNERKPLGGGDGRPRPRQKASTYG